MKSHSWIIEQTKLSVEQWDNLLIQYYPESSRWMKNPESYLQRLTVECNYLNSLDVIDWSRFVNENAIVLDVGCGGGWLSAYLSKFKKISKIYAIDSSLNYLENFLPKITDMMAGERNKISTVQGLFTPIIFESDSVDLIVISSAAHHAESLSSLFEEFFRVLKKGGVLLILNETPRGNFRYTISLIRAFLKVFYSNILRIYKERTPSISASGYKYDPILGDIDYPLWYWKQSIKASKFELLEIINSGKPTVVGSSGRSLVHFVCKK